MSAYSIRQVDGDEYADDLHSIEDACELPRCKLDATWWLAFFEGHPVAYLGLTSTGYLVRVGVLKEHRGNKLQLRMMRVAERFARKNGINVIISDTTQNPPSANNFIAAGYRTYLPGLPWAFSTSIYWSKSL